MSTPTIGAVVLAAGQSSRMPSNKLLIPFRGKPLVRHAVDAAWGSRARPVLVVVGNEADAVGGALGECSVKIVENLDYSAGLSGSLRCGLKALPASCDGAVVLLADMPFVTSRLIDDLIAHFGGPRSICVPVRAGQRGNPVLWGRRHFPEILAVDGDRGAKSLLQAHPDAVCEVPTVDDAVLVDIDTPADLEAYATR